MRPASPNRRGVRITRGIFLIIGLAGIGMIAGGITAIIHKESGTEARATITGCHLLNDFHSTYQCDGSWVEGGSLVGGKGHVVLGVVDDAEPPDIGKTIDVRVSGGEAYTPSLRIPIILLVLGGLLALGSLVLAVAVGRQPARKPIPAILTTAPTSSVAVGEKK